MHISWIRRAFSDRTPAGQGSWEVRTTPPFSKSDPRGIAIIMLCTDMGAHHRRSSVLQRALRPSCPYRTRRERTTAVLWPRSAARGPQCPSSFSQLPRLFVLCFERYYKWRVVAMHLSALRGSSWIWQIALRTRFTRGQEATALIGPSSSREGHLDFHTAARKKQGRTLHTFRTWLEYSPVPRDPRRISPSEFSASKIPHAGWVSEWVRVLPKVPAVAEPLLQTVGSRFAKFWPGWSRSTIYLQKISRVGLNGTSSFTYCPVSILKCSGRVGYFWFLGTLPVHKLLPRSYVCRFWPTSIIINLSDQSQNNLIFVQCTPLLINYAYYFVSGAQISLLQQSRFVIYIAEFLHTHNLHTSLCVTLQKWHHLWPLSHLFRKI